MTDNHTANPQNLDPSRTSPPAGSGRKASATGRTAVVAALLGGVVFVCVNIVSSQLLRNERVDLTQQHLYSLSEGTRTLLAGLKEPVRFRLFMSSGLAKQAPQLAAFAGRVRSLLDSYVAAAKGNIVLEVVDPRPFSEDEDRAVAFGIDGFAGAGGERLFFGLAATNSTTGRSTISVFAPDREPFLEYDLTRLVSELGRRGKPVVALLDGLGLAGNPMARIPEQQVLAQMKQFFDVQPISGEVEKLPEQTRVLMVVHPQNLSARTLYTIDQWVMAGNPAMIFVDPYAENQADPRGGPPQNPTSTLEPLFDAWGVKFDTTRAVGDPDYALQTERNISGRPVVSKNLPWMALRADALSHDDAILAQLSAVVVTTAGAFETTRPGVTLRPLIRASDAAVTLDATIAGDRTGDPRRLLVGLTKSPKQPIIVARLVGTLDSAYPDGLGKDGKPNELKPEETKSENTKPEEGKHDEAKADDAKSAESKPAEIKPNETKTDDAKAIEANATETKASETKANEAKAVEAKADAAKPEGAKTESAKDGGVLKHSVKPPNVILVGDVDMLMDRNWIQQQSLFGQQMAQAFANNGDFVINAVEQMAGGSALSDLRGRGVSWRPFELIQRMEADADSKFRAKEQELTQQLKDTEQKLSQLPKATEGANDVLTPDQVKTMEGFRQQLLSIRSELRDVQFALSRNVDNLKNWVTALNVGFVPVTVGIIALGFGLRRPRKAVPKKNGNGAKNGDVDEVFGSGIMRKSQLVILSLLAAGSVAATAAVLRTSAPTIASDRRGDKVLPALLTRANDITGLTVREGAGRLAIDRRDYGFAAADSGYPVKTDAVRDLVASSAELSFEEARTSDPTRYGDLGLADPGAAAKDGNDKATTTDAAKTDATKIDEASVGKEVVFRTAAGELGDLVIGKTDATVGGAAGGVYVRVKGDPQTFLARGTVRLPSSRADWFMPVDLDVKRSEIKRIALSGGGRESVEANAGKPGELTLANVPENRVADTFKVSRLATLIESFAFEDVRKATKPADDARRMTVDVDNGLRLVLTNVGDVSDGWVQIAVAAPDDAKPDATKPDATKPEATKADAVNQDGTKPGAATKSDAATQDNTKPDATKSDATKSDAAKQEATKTAAKTLAAKVEGYDFRLPSNLSEIMGWTNIDLTNEPNAAPGPTSPPGADRLPFPPGANRLPFPPGLNR